LCYEGCLKELEKILKKEDKINIIEIIKEPILLGKANSLEYKKDRNGGVYLSFEGRKKVWREFVDLIEVLNTKLRAEIAHIRAMIEARENEKV
jgi:predicted DNA repair protein MutK